MLTSVCHEKMREWYWLTEMTSLCHENMWEWHWLSVETRTCYDKIYHRGNLLWPLMMTGCNVLMVYSVQNGRHSYLLGKKSHEAFSYVNLFPASPCPLQNKIRALGVRCERFTCFRTFHREPQQYFHCLGKALGCGTSIFCLNMWEFPTILSRNSVFCLLLWRNWALLVLLQIEVALLGVLDCGQELREPDIFEVISSQMRRIFFRVRSTTTRNSKDQVRSNLIKGASLKFLNIYEITLNAVIFYAIRQLFFGEFHRMKRF